MQFSLPLETNASAEIAAADHYPHVRLFTVGQVGRHACACALVFLGAPTAARYAAARTLCRWRATSLAS